MTTFPRRCLHLLLSLMFFGYAQASVLTLTTEQSSFDLAGQFAYLEDPSRDLAFEQVRSPEFRDRFEQVAAPNLNLGFTRSAVWLTFRLAASSEADDWLLELPYPLLDYIEVYIIKGERVETFLLGDRLPFHARPLDYHTFLLPLELTREPADIFLRVTTQSSMQLRPRLVLGSDFFLRRSKADFFWGLLYGAILLMIIYNAFLFMTTRDHSYLLYVLAAASGTLFAFTLGGYTHQYLAFGAPSLANFLSPLTSSLWLLFTALFAKQFLDVRTYAPRFIYVLRTLISIGILAILLSMATPYFVAMQFATFAAVLHGSLIAAIAAVCLARGHQYARVFMFAWLAYGAGIAVLALSRLGFIPDGFLSYHAGTFGITVETIMLSFALSEKYRYLGNELASYSKGLEAKVRERTEQLETVNEKRKRLLADIVHDLGTPLTVMRGYLQSFRKGALELTPERLTVLDNELRLINNLVEDLRTLSLADSGKLVLERTPTRAEPLLQAVKQTFQQRARETGVVLEVCADKDIPPLELDKERMKRVLDNLVSNALRHTPAGGRVSLRAENKEAEILFEVSDTGEGASEAILNRLFDRFYRADQSRNDGAGSGLGLAIAKSLVELHGGNISAVSELGQGLCVRIALPKCHSHDETGAFLANTPEKPTRRLSVGNEAKKMSSEDRSFRSSNHLTLRR